MIFIFAPTGSYVLSLCLLPCVRMFVHVCVRRYLFWSELNEHRPLIGRANLDGSERIIIADTGLSLPNGLALDYDGNKVYWCDARTNLIERANLDGR